MNIPYMINVFLKIMKIGMLNMIQVSTILLEKKLLIILPLIYFQKEELLYYVMNMVINVIMISNINYLNIHLMLIILINGIIHLM
jgi:hypothetical protein